jgi:hypothetical protein
MAANGMANVHMNSMTNTKTAAMTGESAIKRAVQTEVEVRRGDLGLDGIVI